MTDSSEQRRTVRTPDGERIAVLHLPPLDASERSDGDEPFAVVLAAGFSGWSGKPMVRDLVAGLRRSAPTAGFLVLDLRGHGRSTGWTTFGDLEVLDVDAAVAEARRLGYRRVITMGWSMGASCVLRHSALVGATVHDWPVENPTDAVVTVSAVSRWEARDTPAMRRLHRMIETRLGRMVAHRAFAVRIDPAGWSSTPLSPAEAAARMRVPLLVVHGENDHYFDWEHARVLAAAAGPDTPLWLVPGLGHAELAAVRPDAPPLLERLGPALTALAAGRPVDPSWTAPAPDPAP